MSKRPIGRPETRWEDDVLEDIRSMNVRNWKQVAQDRDSWKKAVERDNLMQVVALYKEKKTEKVTDLVSVEISLEFISYSQIYYIFVKW